MGGQGKNSTAFEEAKKIILDSAARLDGETVELMESLGRVLTRDVAAPWNLPRFATSAMDGFAVRAEDCNAGLTLPVIEFVPAGAWPTKTVEKGTAARIMTGAPVSEGADSVLPFEDATAEGETVRANGAVKPGQNVRRPGEDAQAGEVVLGAGRLIRAEEINLLATCGKTQVEVVRRPRVAILSTGDELVTLGETPVKAQIVNSNAYSLAAAVRALGAEPVMLGIARDTLESHREKISEGLKCDVLITSAGVSVGDKDFVRRVLEEMGVRIQFERVRVRPGKAMAFGKLGTKLVFGLPGNPVSSMLSFTEFAAPSLRKMMGVASPRDQMFEAELCHEVKKKSDLTFFLRVKLEMSEGRWLASNSGVQETGRVRTLVEADAVAVLPEGVEHFAIGARVPVHWLG
ncbi:MAG: molybdopterin molybdotransferase MoeA [Acidobacteriota bacterium]|nr:molybdopterin molybdotransferase MoeA [Acidobacteriota bacterium]